MNIGGFQKLSLVDYPGYPCSIVFTQGCVLRCGYCHNPSLIPLKQPARYTVDEILHSIHDGRSMVDAVCITGGEPTLQQGLLPFMQQVKGLGIRVKLDTNGIRPDVIDEAVSSGVVDYIAMDVKAPWAKYTQVIGEDRGGLTDACRKTFALIQESGVDHEFRTTIHPGVHTHEDMITMASYLQPGERYFVQRTHFDTMLDSSIPRAMPFDSDRTLSELRVAYPCLSITFR